MVFVRNGRIRRESAAVAALLGAAQLIFDQCFDFECCHLEYPFHPRFHRMPFSSAHQGCQKQFIFCVFLYAILRTEILEERYRPSAARMELSIGE